MALREAEAAVVSPDKTPGVPAPHAASDSQILPQKTEGFA